MASIKVTDGPTIRAIFSEAAQRNQSLDLARQLDSGEDMCRSRFVETPERKLVVEVPSRQGHLVPVRPGEDVEVYFRLKERRYWFASRVEERSSIALSADMAMPVLVLRWPKTLELRQRRRHYRVSLGPTSQLMASLWPVPEPGAKASPARLPSMEVLDVSAGGMRLLYPYAEGCPVEEGASLTAALPLSPGEPPVKLAARVVRVARFASNATHIAAVFTELDESLEGKVTRNKLVRFVAAREREELQRMRGTS